MIGWWRARSGSERWMLGLVVVLLLGIGVRWGWISGEVRTALRERFPSSSSAAPQWMLVGTYTGSGSEGIYVYRFDPSTARAERVGLAAIDNPSYLSVSADGATVYAVSEGGDDDSRAAAFSFDRSTGALTSLGGAVATSGSAPCNIATNGGVVVTANYGGGDVSVFEALGSGAVGPLRQSLRLPAGGAASHMHCVKFSADGRWLFAADLGSDKLLRWSVRGGEIDEASLVDFDLPPGSGPRHFVFDRSGEHLYLINELSGTAMVFTLADGALSAVQTIQADRADGRGSADIVFTPDGRHLYTSHRLKNDGVAHFTVDASGGTLTPEGYHSTGLHPRNLNITPDGRFLTVAARDSGAVEFYSIDPASGALTPLPESTLYVDKPVCVIFL